MGKSKKTTVGYWYKPAFHAGLGIGPIDAYLEFRGGDKPAWQGRLTSSGTIRINAPNLWGGEKDQGGILGDVDVMFGEAGQQANAYLMSAFGPQQSAWRGLATLVFKGGKYGAMNPYPQKAAHKIERIIEAMRSAAGEGEGWYPEKASIWIGENEHVLIADSALAAPTQYVNPGTPVDYVEVSGQSPDTVLLVTMPAGLTYTAWSPWPSDGAGPPGGSWTNQFSVTTDNETRTYLLEGYRATAAASFENAQSQLPIALSGSTSYKFWLSDVAPGDDRGGVSLRVTMAGDVAAMNPAHILYYSRTHRRMGRQPVEIINEASFRAGADYYHAQGFGLCTEYDPSAESVEEFEQRICRVAGCAITRSLINGQWYLDVANGQYDLDSLPVLTDDDILDFEEQPTLPDGAVNSVSVKYFDPEKKEAIVTPPVQAPALVSDFGTNHLTIEYLEIPTSKLALRVAQRELLARISPLRGFQLKTTRKPHAWRPGTYFRLQLPKRRIADVVCIFSEKSSGQLRSGAMSITVMQDVYSLPESAFVDVEVGVDTGNSQRPLAIVHQAAFEAPYIEVVVALSRADLEVLPAETSYLLAAAADPATSRNFTLTVDAVAGYEDVAQGDWSATATVNEGSGYEDQVFTLGNRRRLDEVEPGMAALWGTEIVRVDSLNPITGEVTFGRGCADTVPVKHAAGERVWFYQVGGAIDPNEYTDGESVSVKLLTNTGSQQLAIDAATAIEVEFAGRAARPYPPGQFRINGELEVDAVMGEITVTGVHRDRVQQADQLVDVSMAGIGPEAGTTYTVRYYVNGVLEHTDDELPLPESTYTPIGSGLGRVEMEAVRSGLASYQMHVRQFSLGSPLLLESGELITMENGDPILME